MQKNVQRRQMLNKKIKYIIFLSQFIILSAQAGWFDNKIEVRKCYDPKDGSLKRELKMPFMNVTSCAFGGDHLDQLYVTSACQRMSEAELEKQPLAGSLISVNPGSVGVPSFKYGG